jgi:hypothetical protein
MLHSVIFLDPYYSSIRRVSGEYIVNVSEVRGGKEDMAIRLVGAISYLHSRVSRNSPIVFNPSSMLMSTR